jgi:2-polyprenyl-3-methyl-5-hydroxy-6-metoxy-1,4-benzoquinol methylase
MSTKSQVPDLAAWRIDAAVGTQGISNDGIYEMIEAELKALNAHGAVLDYGAGVGNLTRRLIELPTFDEVYAADLFEPATNLKVSGWLQQDLNQSIPGYDEYFDTIIASEVIEHLENPRFIARELFRLCKPGGSIVLTTPNNESIRSLMALAIRGHFVHFDKGWYPGHITALVRKDLLRILVEAGFEPLGFRFTQTGSLPGAPTRNWQQISFGILRGLRFSNNLLVSARKRKA